MTETKPTVYFDGSCPLCRREIDFYRKQPGSSAVAWTDVSCVSDAQDLGGGLTPDAAMARFHVRQADGSLVSGAAGFAVLWQQLPRFARAGRIAGLPVVRHILELGYRAFLPLRPVMQRIAARFDR